MTSSDISVGEFQHGLTGLGPTCLNRIPRFYHGMTVVKTAISMTPELHSALTRAALAKDDSISRRIEIYLRENPSVQKYLREVEAEPLVGAHVARSKRTVAPKTRTKELTVSS